MVDVRSRYLKLLQLSLGNELYLENEMRIGYLRERSNHESPYSKSVLISIKESFPGLYDELCACRSDGRNLRNQVIEWPHTMIGRKRLDNIQFAIETILAEGIPGDFLEAGVWRGGASLFARAVFDVTGGEERNVWLADSFEGLPLPTLKEDSGYDFSKEKFPSLAIGLDTVRELFSRYEIATDHVHFLKGWFKDTLPSAPVGQLSVLRLDGDLYESTMDTLIPLYDKVASGGFIIVDDYGAFPPCRKAIEDFRHRRQIFDHIHAIDWCGIYWRKGS